MQCVPAALGEQVLPLRVGQPLPPIPRSLTDLGVMPPLDRHTDSPPQQLVSVRFCATLPHQQRVYL